MALKKIDEMKGEFCINNSIYNEKAVKEAIDDFKEVCSIMKKDDSYIMEVKEGYELEETYGEFFNYLLGLMKE